jgi:pimeloyl-ACP methyl ester carboxylesterase
MNQVLGRFNTGSVELAYTEWPGDSPPVVFLHGMTTGRAFWSPARIEPRGQQRALAFDARGHGDSRPGPFLPLYGVRR